MPRSAADQPDTSNMKPLSGSVTPPVGAPALPAYPPAPNPYLRTPLPADQQLQPDVLRQFYNKGVPQTRIVPLPTTAKASINSSAQGIAKTVVRQTASSPSISSVSLTAPQELAVSGSPVVPPSGTLGLAWVAETPGYVFSGPLPSLTGFQGTASGSASDPVACPPTTVTMTPQTPTSFGLVLINNGSPPSGWTQADVTFDNLCYKVITGTAPVSATIIAGGLVNFIDMALFTGPAPTLVQTGHGGISSAPLNLPFGSSNFWWKHISRCSLGKHHPSI